MDNVASFIYIWLAANKYDLMKTIHKVVETGQIQIDWKMYIKGIITNYERIRWEATTKLYGDINVYREVIGRNEVWFW